MALSAPSALTFPIDHAQPGLFDFYWASYVRTDRQAVNPLQRYERHRKWIALFLWAVGILLALLVAIFPGSDAFTIGTPVIIVLVGSAVHLMLASGKAAI